MRTNNLDAAISHGGRCIPDSHAARWLRKARAGSGTRAAGITIAGRAGDSRRTASAPETTSAAQPAPDAPSPTEPSAVPKPTAANEPRLESMSVATPSAKIERGRGCALQLRLRARCQANP